MGFLDDAVPGGNITKPLLVALGVLLAGKMFAGRKDDTADDEEPARIPDARSPQADTPSKREAGPDSADAETGGKGGGGILDGLGDLLNNLGKSGQKETADSWVKPDAENKQINPTDLGKAIGQKTLSEISRRTGLSEQELLDKLSSVLPGVVDKLTPDGRVPTNKEVAKQISDSPW